MTERTEWQQLCDQRMAEPGAADAYEAARLAFELGKAVREMREQRGWTQIQLAQPSGMTQPVVARFEAGGTIPTIPVLDRLAHDWTSNSWCGSRCVPPPPDSGA